MGRQRQTFCHRRRIRNKSGLGTTCTRAQTSGESGHLDAGEKGRGSVEGGGSKTSARGGHWQAEGSALGIDANQRCNPFAVCQDGQWTGAPWSSAAAERHLADAGAPASAPAGSSTGCGTSVQVLAREKKKKFRSRTSWPQSCSGTANAFARVVARTCALSKAAPFVSSQQQRSQQCHSSACRSHSLPDHARACATAAGIRLSQ